eukprot:symbB.v1.2.032375.t1/scaffold3884.1/size52087/3
MGKFQVNGVLRDKERALAWASDLPGLSLFEADTRDASALEHPLRDASAVVCTTGVPAFGISGQWEKGNHPETVDHFGVKNVAHVWSTAPGSKRRFVLMSSIGVTRRDGFPYSILNGGGVLDAKARGEATVSQMAQERGFGVTIVRPGQLFGGPYENNRYLGTLFQLDKDSGTNAVTVQPGDTAVGDTLRSSLAGVLVRCLFTTQSQLEFSVVNDKGSPPSEEEIDQMLANMADPKSEANEQMDKRLGLAQETLGEAVKNVVSGKASTDMTDMFCLFHQILAMLAMEGRENLQAKQFICSCMTASANAIAAAAVANIRATTAQALAQEHQSSCSTQISSIATFAQQCWCHLPRCAMKFALLSTFVAPIAAIAAVRKEAPPNPDEVALPAVPNVVAAGKSGFPELPTVSAMLDQSTKTLSGISSRAQKLQQQMLDVQQENAARMQKQKAVFDRKLKEQEEKNMQQVKENAILAKKIMMMKQENEELLKHAQDLEKGNALRHGELQMLQDQLLAAQNFLKETLSQTDDSKAADLEVMKDQKPKALSFLAVLEEHDTGAPENPAEVPAEPENLLTMLANEVKTMKKQGQDSEAKLKSLFMDDFQAGVKRHNALVAQNKVLTETLEKMQSYRAKLEAADKHLQETQSTLQTRLHDGGLFMQKLSELTLAKPDAAASAASLLAGQRAETKSGYENPGAFSEAERAVFNSPYALSYFGGKLEDEDEDNYLDYGQYTVPEDELDEEDEIIRAVKAGKDKDKCVEYVVDNTELQADAPGVAYRFSCRLDDRDEKRPDASDGWVKVGDRFLPLEVNGCKVLLHRGPSKFRAEKRLEDLNDSEDEIDEKTVSGPWKDQKHAGSIRRKETPEEPQPRLQKEHEDHEQRSRELLRKHHLMLQEPAATNYSVLGIKRTATADEISQAFKVLCKLYHPDKADASDRATRAARERVMAGTPASRFVTRWWTSCLSSKAKLNEAYAVLSCPTQRWAYDRTLAPADDKVDAELDPIRAVVRRQEQVATRSGSFKAERGGGICFFTSPAATNKVAKRPLPEPATERLPKEAAASKQKEVEASASSLPPEPPAKVAHESAAERLRKELFAKRTGTDSSNFSTSSDNYRSRMEELKQNLKDKRDELAASGSNDSRGQAFISFSVARDGQKERARAQEDAGPLNIFSGVSERDQGTILKRRAVLKPPRAKTPEPESHESEDDSPWLSDQSDQSDQSASEHSFELRDWRLLDQPMQPEIATLEMPEAKPAKKPGRLEGDTFTAAQKRTEDQEGRADQIDSSQFSRQQSLDEGKDENFDAKKRKKKRKKDKKEKSEEKDKQFHDEALNEVEDSVLLEGEHQGEEEHAILSVSSGEEGHHEDHGVVECKFVAENDAALGLRRRIERHKTRALEEARKEEKKARKKAGKAAEKALKALRKAEKAEAKAEGFGFSNKKQKTDASRTSQEAEWTALRELSKTCGQFQDDDSAEDTDFDFTGDSRPFRCKGKAARVAKSCGSRENVKMVMHQLVGKCPMELADCQGVRIFDAFDGYHHLNSSAIKVIRHVGPMTPLGGLGECGHPNCLAHRLKHPEVRAGFRDFIVSKVRDAVRTNTCWWGREGLRYASLGSGELLFDLELLERLREEADVRISQICLIDREYETPSAGTRRALREFADWQRASAQLRRHDPAEILAFGRLADYFQASTEGGCAVGCHVFVQCRALCKDGLLARLAESTDTMDADLPKGALVAPFQGDLLPRQENLSTKLNASDGSELISTLSIAHLGGLHVGEPFFSACFKPPSLQPVDHPLLSRREEASRIRIVGKERGLAVWLVTCTTRIAVRAGPHAQAQVVDVFYKGDEVLSAPRDFQGPWLRIAKESWPNPVDAPDEAWVLQDGTDFGLGILLEQVSGPK